MKFEAAKSPEALRMKLLNEWGEHVDTACAFDTDEGWFEMYLRASESRCYVDRKKQEMYKVRVHAGFEVRDRDTDMVLHRVRWGMTTNDPKIMESF